MPADGTKPFTEDAEMCVTFRSDTATLTGMLYRPAGTVIAAAVVHGATGVPQRFYAAFARWLAGQGIAVLTYDYRDFGTSAVGPAHCSTATLVDWGLRDQQAAQRELETLVPGVPVWVIGHSLGGLMLPFQYGAGRVDRLIAVASGPVHFSDHPWHAKPLVAAFWHGVGPAAIALTGRLPGLVWGATGDLPRGVFRQWRRWCTARGFHLGDIGKLLPVPDFRAFCGEARFIAMADDAMVPPAATWRLMQFYPEARKRQKVVRPADYGLKRVGHIAAFHRDNAVLWPDIVGPLPREDDPARR